jgi:hypothetical protein
MIAFAEQRNTNRNVRFELADATDLTGFEPRAFDYATVMFLLHEIPPEDQIQALTEASRVAKTVIAVDSRVPLPCNFHGIALRLAEATAGPAHFLAFLKYLAAGGITSVLADRRFEDAVTRRSVFWHDCREMIVLEGSTGSAERSMPPA